MKMLGVVLGARLRLGPAGRRMMSTTTTIANHPWLMLPPTFDRRRGGMVYNFYSPAEQEVVLVNKYGPGPDPPEFPDDNAKVVGSSHGWLALMNRRNNELFLSNPITRRHIRLPPIQSLPNPELNLEHDSGKAMVSKLILSASPDDECCRAMVSFGRYDRLAFCRPGHSREWVPIGKLFVDRDEKPYKIEYPKAYDDFVYSSKSNVFTCLTKSELHGWGLEDWDLTNMDSPKADWIRTNIEPEPEYENDDELDHLVYAEETDELFLVMSCVELESKTKALSFLTLRVGKGEDGRMERYHSSFGDLTLFVGTNHAFAISASPHFNPNSIYFTHHKQYHRPDVGIYDCSKDTLSNCYYPHKTFIFPAPIWFTPTLT